MNAATTAVCLVCGAPEQSDDEVFPEACATCLPSLHGIHATLPGRYPNPGRCVQCEQDVDERVLIRIIERMSGPSASADACLPCAREYAKTSAAPRWLRVELAARDARRGE